MDMNEYISYTYCKPNFLSSWLDVLPMGNLLFLRFHCSNHVSYMIYNRIDFSYSTILPVLSAFHFGIKGNFLIVLEDACCRCLLDIFEYVAIVFVLTSTGATLDITANGVVIGHMNLQNTLPLNKMY